MEVGFERLTRKVRSNSKNGTKIILSTGYEV